MKESTTAHCSFFLSIFFHSFPTSPDSMVHQAAKLLLQLAAVNMAPRLSVWTLHRIEKYFFFTKKKNESSLFDLCPKCSHPDGVSCAKPDTGV